MKNWRGKKSVTGAELWFHAVLLWVFASAGMAEVATVPWPFLHPAVYRPYGPAAGYADRHLEVDATGPEGHSHDGRQVSISSGRWAGQVAGAVGPLACWRPVYHDRDWPTDGRSPRRHAWRYVALLRAVEYANERGQLERCEGGDCRGRTSEDTTIPPALGGDASKRSVGMDEFLLFCRALSTDEFRQLDEQGKPSP